jgi:DNA-binding PadR family transcriptional regulator
MSEPKITLLGHILLGLIQQQAQSGYDLRKLFASTPLGSYSDSPGAIYPALGKLEEHGLIRGRQETAGLRGRCVYRITPQGLAQLRKWLLMPITRPDVVRKIDELLARFSFMEGILGREGALEFLRKIERELSSYSSELRSFLRGSGPAMAISGRLAMDCGVRSYEALLKWSRAAIDTYQQS